MDKRRYQLISIVILIVLFFSGLTLLINMILMNSEGYKCVNMYLQQDPIVEKYGSLKKIGIFYNSSSHNSSHSSKMQLQFLARNEQGKWFRCSFFLTKASVEWVIEEVTILALASIRISNVSIQAGYIS